MAVRIERLQPKIHDRSAFACGERSLDLWLRERAGQAERKDTARTYVTCEGTTVIGYYSVCAYSVLAEDAPAAVAQGRLPIPAILLARLAVDAGHHGRGIGSALLLDAFTIATRAADAIGARLLVVHALNAKAIVYYSAHGFRSFDADASTLYLPMQHLRATLRALGLM